MYFGCELQIPQKAYEIENKRRIAFIFEKTGIKIDQILKEGLQLCILRNDDVYGVIYSDNAVELLEIGIALVKTGIFDIEFGTDLQNEITGAGTFILSKEGKFTSF